MTPAHANAPGQTVTLGLIQSACGDDRAANIARTAALVRDAAARGAQVVCLQELFATRYFCQVEDARLFDLAEPIPGPTTEAMAALARELRIVLIVPLFEKRDAGLYHNSLVVFGSDGASLGVYRKMHIPDDPQYYEKFYFAPGDLGWRTFATPHGDIGTLICWDQWFPEGARLTAMAGAKILFYPTAIGWLPADKPTLGDAQHDAWETSMRAHAIANGVFVAAANRVGFEGDVEFWGQSFVCNPQGVVVARASQDKEEALVVTIDLGEIETQRRGWPFLRDRRIDAYEGLMSRYLK